jgi:hypothetical protein
MSGVPAEIGRCCQSGWGLGIIGVGFGNPKSGYGRLDYMEREFRAAGNAQTFFLSFGDENLFARRIGDVGVILIGQVYDVAGARRAAGAVADIIEAHAQKRATTGCRSVPLWRWCLQTSML